MAKKSRAPARLAMVVARLFARLSSSPSFCSARHSSGASADMRTCTLAYASVLCTCERRLAMGRAAHAPLVMTTMAARTSSCRSRMPELEMGEREGIGRFATRYLHF